MKLLLWISGGINAFIFGGDPTEPLGARRWRERKHQTLDKWLGHNHCQRLYERQKERFLSREHWLKHGNPPNKD